MNTIKQAVSPAIVKRLSPAQKGIFFDNPSRGCTFIISPAPSVYFSIDTSFVTYIKDIESNNTNNFDVLGAIKWLKEKEEVSWKLPKADIL